MSKKIPFWCIETKKHLIIAKLKDADLWFQLIKLICEKDKEEFTKRLVVFAKEITFIFSLVYITKFGQVKKLPAKKYKEMLFDWPCEDAEEMELRLHYGGIRGDANDVYKIYEAIASLVSTIISKVGNDRIHCAEIAFYAQYIIEMQGDLPTIVYRGILPSNIPKPPHDFLPEEFVI